MAVKKDHAIVVRSYPLGEVDRIITFCTLHTGKVRAVANGSRRPTSRLAASLELFNVGELVYFEKPNRDLHRVNSFDVENAIGTRLRDPLCVAYASHFAELSSEFSLENDHNPDLYGLLDDGLERVAGSSSVGELRRLARGFEIRLLTLGGYGPRLDRCVVCDVQVPEDEASVGTSVGGVLCARHARFHRTMVVSGDALRASDALGRGSLGSAKVLDLSRQASVELRKLFGFLLAEHLERRLRCADYIEMLEKNADDATPVSN